MSARAKAIWLCILACIIEDANANALSQNAVNSAQKTNLTKSAENISTHVRANASNLAADVGPQHSCGTFAEMSWLKQWQLLRQQTRDCIKLTKNTSWNCFKVSSLRIFDDVMGARVIPLGEGVRFVRLQEVATAAAQHEKSLDTYERQDLQHLTWFDRLAMRLAKTLTTHMLQINLKQLTDAYMRAVDNAESAKKVPPLAEAVGTARHRRHRYNIMMTMMFGATALGAVLVPMGFQLLSIVSGKALLLAKMALLLASINGLKRVANSGVHYGLYHMPGESYNGYYDRGDVHHPRNVASIAMAQPLDMGIRK